MLTPEDYFELVWAGDVLVIVPASSVEKLSWDTAEAAVDLILRPLRVQRPPLICLDIADVAYFGSVFLSIMSRIVQFSEQHSGRLAASGPNRILRDLFAVTGLDTIWSVHPTREDAVDWLSGADELHSDSTAADATESE